MRAAPAYWIARWLFERALGVMYLVAFASAINHFVPLLGERGLLPVSRFTAAVPFRESPSLFYLWQTNLAFRTAGWCGVAVACLIIAGVPQRHGAIAAGIAWST